jgi:hypothetical protein
VASELDPPRPPPPDRTFAVPDQGAWYRTECVDQPPPAGGQVVGAAGRDQNRRQPARVAGHHRQHRKLHRGTRLPEPHRNRRRWKPQVALRDIPGLIGRPARRVRRQVGRPQLADTFLEHRHPTCPSDPLGDHRSRHGRHIGQLSTNRVLEGIHRRPRHVLGDRSPAELFTALLTSPDHQLLRR